MPEVGELKQVYIKESRQYIWVECPVCKGQRWMQLRNYKRGGSTGMCLACYNTNQKTASGILGKKRGGRKGGERKKAGEGYLAVKLEPDDFFYSMVNRKGWVKEHRLIMAKYLNRCLLPWEIVHHKNGKRDDNRLENLQLLTDGRFHIVESLTKSYIRKLEKELSILKKKG